MPDDSTFENPKKSFVSPASVIHSAPVIILEALIRLGAPLEALDADGRSVFQWATQTARQPVMDILVDFGCPVWQEAWILNEQDETLSPGLFLFIRSFVFFFQS